MDPAEKRRLYWKCRRGLLELDIVLQRYLLKHPEDSTLAELLDLPDNALLFLKRPDRKPDPSKIATGDALASGPALKPSDRSA